MIKETVISAKKEYQIRDTLSEIFKQSFLIFLFVKRDYNTYYKQTILGPFWFFIQPVFTMIVYVFIFSKLAGVGTGSIPGPLFYLSGIICWNYFSENTLKVSTTFIDNAHIFGKVYYPRIVMPVANMLTSYLKLSIQFILLLCVTMYYGISTINLSIELLLFPVCLLFIGIFSTSLGVIVSALTTKYRDLRFFTQFAIQLLMYGSAVVWPLPLLEKMTLDKHEWLYDLALYNPLIHFIEGFRFSMFGDGYFNPIWFAYSCVISIVLFLIGILLFSRTEKDFMDTI